MLIMEMAIDIDHSQLIKRLSPIGYPVIEADCINKKLAISNCVPTDCATSPAQRGRPNDTATSGVLKDQQMRGAITA